MSLFDIYKAIKVGRSDSLFASVVGTKLNKDAWKKGFNKWDEEWENGRFNTTTGDYIATTAQIRSKNYIDVVGGQTYYFGTPTLTGSGQGMWVMFFDESKNVISGYVPTESVDIYQNVYRPQNKAMTIPQNARYAKFYVTPEYGTTYNNDICINISGEHNGEYVPYNG